MKHVEGSQTDKVLKCLQDNKVITGEAIAKLTGVSRSNVYVFLKRLKKWYAINLVSEGVIRTFTYVGELALMEHDKVKHTTIDKALHLLQALETLNVDTMEATLGVNTPEALEIMAYLIRTEKAIFFSAECTISLI